MSVRARTAVTPVPTVAAPAGMRGGDLPAALVVVLAVALSLASVAGWLGWTVLRGRAVSLGLLLVASVVGAALVWVLRPATTRVGGVRALGLRLPRAGHVQVSLNVEDWRSSPLHEVVAAVERAAAARGLRVTGSELVGLLPAGAAVAAAGALLGVTGLDQSHVLELRLLDS